MEYNSQDQKVHARQVIGIRNGRACVLKHTKPKWIRPSKRVKRKVLERPTIPLEHGIPIPQKRTAGRKLVYYIDTVRRMYVGDSFFLEGINSVQVSSMSKYWKQSTGFKFTVREMDNGTRVWRTK